VRNETNNDNGHEGLPEALYRRYRLERQGASDVATKPGERSATAAGSVEVNVESLFRAYQSQRASSSASATLKPVAGRLGVVKQFFIGAVAASMFAFIVVPQLVQHVADDGIVVAALPPALLENAEHVTTHIGSDRGGSFAFSSSDEPSFVAFRHGVVSVDLRLHLLANQAEAVVPLLGNLVGQQPVSGDAETDSDEIQQSAQYLFDGIRERLNNQELTQRLNAVVASLDGSARNSKKLLSNRRTLDRSQV